MSWCNSVAAAPVARGFRLRAKRPPSLKLRRTAIASAEAGRRTAVALAEAVSRASVVVSGFSRTAAIVAIALLSTSCGYALAGRGSFLPESIQTIGIPTFGNNTSYLDIAQMLTDKVRTEFIGRGRYRIIPEAEGADALLSGQVTAISIAPASFNQGQQASRYVITVSARIELRDVQKDAVLWQNPSMTFQEEYEAAGGVDVTDPTAFFGQESNAVQRISTEFARALVSAILEAF